jgi:hypothetical protein
MWTTPWACKKYEKALKQPSARKDMTQNMGICQHEVQLFTSKKGHNELLHGLPRDALQHLHMLQKPAHTQNNPFPSSVMISAMLISFPNLDKRKSK